MHDGDDYICFDKDGDQNKYDLICYDKDGDQNKYEKNKTERQQKTDAPLRHMREWLVGVKSDGSKR